ncbi:MAG: UbiX family flavin prenyltransferase [Candidatus Omnitrophica bacterium]|nr:UbiX family flavin prenyltransferase [Candidatus Omnitrophota bacterium]
MMPYIVAMTGASGAAYGVRLIQVLRDLNYPIVFLLSDPARLVIQEELKMVLQESWEGRDFQKFLGPFQEHQFSYYSCRDMTAPVASGSYPVKGMIVCPCSMATLGAIANGTGQNLIHRAADCQLKEGRRLILVPRETPLHAGHLENMLKAFRLGARIVPAMPAFYAETDSISNLVDFMVGKILDQLEIEHELYPRWTGLPWEKLCEETS